MRDQSTVSQSISEVAPFVDLIDEGELSRRTGISAQTWRKYRHSGKSPPYFKLGKHIRYDWADVCRWLEGKRRYSTSPTRAEQAARKSFGALTAKGHDAPR